MPPLGCDTTVHTLGKEGGGWDGTLTLSSLLEGATGMLHPATPHPVAELLWNQLRSSATRTADLHPVPNPARAGRSFWWKMSCSFG